ncbi:hypothetical protein KR50_12250 [Jeotgalibacillus campisalis]|uniref:Uncharacterized protein n=1 Tax=Jeotgalibacillus campisalis TaxID=220754 RepID=A0A0C2REG5_9BACL|nr:hypothetical protein KR50_12250 [Jeotgalibacillus campisalis]
MWKIKSQVCLKMELKKCIPVKEYTLSAFIKLAELVFED